MAHTKSQGKTAQKANRPGQRLGVKLFGGQKIKVGQIIVRQRGTNFHPGVNTSLGRDYTLYAKCDGVITFAKKLGKRIVSVQK